MNATMRLRALIVCTAAVIASAAPRGQSAVRALKIAPASTTAAGDWAVIVDRMVRGDELRTRLTRTDTLLTGRTVEQLTQYYKGVHVWGGSVARQLD